MLGIANGPFSRTRWGHEALGAFFGAVLGRGPGSADRGSADVLVERLDTAKDVGSRLSAQVHEAEDNGPLANAASICRWELLMERQRVLETEVAPSLRSARTELIRLLDGAAAAARTMSAGYRFHSLDRICRGGEALDDHLTAMSRLRLRLAPAN